MKLIDKYIIEVGKYLPRKNRADIEAEIRSTLEDMLDERMQTSGERVPADEATVMEVLKEYGSPREVAAKYKTHQYLIGPRLFPLFEMILRIVFTVVTVVSFIGLGVTLAKTGLSGVAFVSAIKDWFLNLVGGLVAAFGNITVIFAIMERTPMSQRYEKEFNEWDPKDLEKEHDPDEVDLPDHIATIIFTFLGLVIVNLYPNVLSIGFVNNSTWTSMPILTEAFFRFLPWINIMGLLQIVFNGYMLSRREWQTPTRIISIVMDIAQAFLLIIILRAPGIFGVTPEALSAAGIKESADVLSRLVNWIPTLVLVIVVVVTIVKVAQSSMRLFRDRSKSPYPVLNK